MADSSEARSKSLHHVAYATRDPEATYAFYSGQLGIPLVHTENHKQGDGFFRHFFFDMGRGDYLAFFEIGNVLYIVMDFAEGGDLFNLII